LFRQDGKSFTDEEANSDLSYLVGELEKDLSKLSTFEMYLKELDAGKLHWTQVHTEKFWKENVNRMEDDDFSAVKYVSFVLNMRLTRYFRALIRLLDSDSIETVAIACYDLGEFARYYPGGKK
jgi:V-type H+-transporting ATPase subunit H